MKSSVLYDFVVVVTNDLNSDQRMHRICETLVEFDKNVLLLGHEKKSSQPLFSKIFNQKRLKTWIQKGPLFYLEYNLRVFFFLLKINANKLYSVDLDTLSAVALSSAFKKIPFVFDAHELFSELPELEGKPLKKLIWSSIGKLFIKKAEVRLCAGHALSAVLEKKYDVPFIPLYNYPKRILKSKNNADYKSIVLLYQGKVNKGRGIPEMIKAMTYLDNRFKLWIAGDGDLFDDLRKANETDENNDRIQFLGWRSPADLVDITPSADLGVNLLNRQSKNYYWSAANKVYDYIMAGVPCLTMNFPEYQKLQNDHDVLYLISHLDPKLLAESIFHIFKNTDDYQIKKQNCTVAREKLNWKLEKQKLNILF